MSVPTKKTGITKTRIRRSHLALSVPTTATCPKCKQARLPHRVCPHCGYYKDRTVMQTTSPLDRKSKKHKHS